MRRTILAAGCLASLAVHAAAFNFGAPAWEATGSKAQVVAVGDVNGDQLDDVVVATNFGADAANDYSVLVSLQQPDGTLAAALPYAYVPRTDIGNRLDLALADLDGDGSQDVIACYNAGLLLLFQGNAGFDRVDLPGNPCSAVAVLDANRDGNPDIVANDYGSATFLYGDGQRGFAQGATTTLAAPNRNRMAVGDVTGDGVPDLVVVPESGNIKVYPQAASGLGTARAYASPGGVWGLGGVAVGDFNGDGRKDVAVTETANSPDAALWVLPQTTAGTLGAPLKMASDDLPYAVVAADLNHDGRSDLLVGHDGWFAVGRYMGGRSALFAEARSSVAYNESGRALAAGDVNDDGCLDAVVAEHNYGRGILLGSGCPLRRAHADVDGDGRSDLVWRNAASCDDQVWPHADAALAQALTALPEGWDIAGTGDFDGDGRADVLWHNASDGSSMYWSGADPAGRFTMARITDLHWQIVGIGDFNGDGRDDVLWRNAATGRDAIWKSARYVDQQAIASLADSTWHVGAVADFDGDRKDDVLWRNSGTGANMLWPAGDATIARILPKVGISMAAVAGDFDGDGKADILWRNASSGHNVIWRAANRATPMPVADYPDPWQIAFVGDFNADRKDDVLWRNTNTGENLVWRAARATVPMAVDTFDPWWLLAR